MINFKERFNKFVLDKGINKPTAHDFEHNYYEFIETFIPEIQSSPVEYFEKVLDDDLLAMFDVDEVPFQLVLDEIQAREGLDDFLKDRLGESEFKDRFIYEYLLKGEDSITYALDILSDSDDEKTVVMAIDSLINEIDIAYDAVLDLFNTGDDRAKIRCIDVLAFGKQNDLVFSYMIDLFNNKKNIQLYAYYLGRYGNEKAVPFLKNMLESSDLRKEEKQEIENSIEMLE